MRVAERTRLRLHAVDRGLVGWESCGGSQDVDDVSLHEVFVGGIDEPAFAVERLVRHVAPEIDDWFRFGG